jgi:hypothetical protein
MISTSTWLKFSTFRIPVRKICPRASVVKVWKYLLRIGAAIVVPPVKKRMA